MYHILSLPLHAYYIILTRVIKLVYQTYLLTAVSSSVPPLLPSQLPTLINQSRAIKKLFSSSISDLLQLLELSKVRASSETKWSGGELKNVQYVCDGKRKTGRKLSKYVR